MTGRERWERLTSVPWLLSQVGDAMVRAGSAVSRAPFAEAYRTVRPYTVCGGLRLYGLYRAVEHVATHGIPGCLVECGTARGGSAALMALAAGRVDPGRLLWVFDTFEGLPPATGADGDRAITGAYMGRCRGSLAEVQAFFGQVGILDRARLVKGLFQETLPATPVGPIAVLHIDGDWYESVMACLEHLYDRVSPGGIVQIDDYGHWPGARKAVDEFRQRRAITAPLRRLDYTGRQLVKPGAASGARPGRRR